MDFLRVYEEKKRTPEEIIDQVQPGWSCCADISGATPPILDAALGKRAAVGKIRDVTFHTWLDIVPLGTLAPEAFPNIRTVTWFSGGGLRKAVNEGRADIMPCYYRDAPGLFDRYIDIDAYFAQVSPMDEHGYFSVSLSGSCSEVMIRKAKHIYLEVNDKMPRALTAPLIHISQVDALCETSCSLPIMPPVKIDDISRKIGGYIAEEIPDGATLQLGIGAVPEAVGLALKDKHDLGLHTELFTDSMVELLECGAVTNMKKPINRGKTVTTLTFGSQRIYDYLDDNPAFLMMPVDYVNNPAVIAQHPNFISVNAAVEVDFFGQVCSESAGMRHISGTGGQADYVRGAVMSKGGKSFIAFPSTAKGGTISKIVPTLTPGAIVTTSKNDVDYIVTEYGVAKLRGKTLSQRAKELIKIAHPKFREELTFAAKKMNILI